MTPRSCPGSARWLFRRHTPTCGSAPVPTDTSRLPDEMRERGSSTAITPSGGRSGTRPSSAVCWASARRCRRSGRGWSATSACRGFPAKRFLRRWSGCSSAPASGWATTSTPSPTAPTGSPLSRTATSKSPAPTSASSSAARAGKPTRSISMTGGSARIVRALPGPAGRGPVSIPGRRRGAADDWIRRRQ